MVRICQVYLLQGNHVQNVTEILDDRLTKVRVSSLGSEYINLSSKRAGSFGSQLTSVSKECRKHRIHFPMQHAWLSTEQGPAISRLVCTVYNCLVGDVHN